MMHELVSTPGHAAAVSEDHIVIHEPVANPCHAEAVSEDHIVFYAVKNNVDRAQRWHSNKRRHIKDNGLPIATEFLPVVLQFFSVRTRSF